MSLVSSTNNVVIDPTLSRVVISVEQNGSPFGVVSFLGDILGTQRVTEEAVPSVLSLPLERDGDFSAPIDVTYAVTRIDSAESAALDVSPVSGTVTFPVLRGRTSLDLTILADDIPEQDEIFSVTLLGATGGATINTQANMASFIITLVTRNMALSYINVVDRYY